MNTSLHPLKARLPSGLITAYRILSQRFLSLSDSSTPLLPFIPKPVKILFLLILILNSPSWPFLWHLRVWKTPLNAYRLVFTKGAKKYTDDWIAQTRASGGVGGTKTRRKRLAWIDDCDYNMHLSNSSYAKSLDASRMDWCIEVMSPLFTAGAYAALGASHYVFFKEIPVGTQYVMETRCGGWGDKWVYLITEFIIYPKNRSSKPSTTPAGPSLSLPTPSGLLPESITNSNPDSGSNTPATSVEQIKKSYAVKPRGPRADGGVVCCLAVSEYCFKLNRVTVPPRIALYLSLQSPNESDRLKARQIAESKDHGRAFIKGGWKEVEEADKLGLDIGLDGGYGGRDMDTNKEEGDVWIKTGRDAMGKVVEGLSEM